MRKEVQEIRPGTLTFRDTKTEGKRAKENEEEQPVGGQEKRGWHPGSLVKKAGMTHCVQQG